MGAAASRIGGFQDVVVFRTDSRLDFAMDQIRNSYTAQASGMMQVLAQQGAVGGGGSSSMNRGYNPASWVWLANYIRYLTPTGVVIGLVGALATYFLNLSKLAMAAFVFVGMFFIIHTGSYSFKSELSNIAMGRTFMFSLVTAGIIGSVIGLAVYTPKD